MAMAPMPMWGQWNGTNPVWTNSNVGIGTATPQNGLEISGPSSMSSLRLDALGANGYVFETTGAAGSYGLNLTYRNPTSLFANIMSFTYWGNVGIGATNPQYKLSVNGNIGAQDIIVTNTGWSDYVFRPGYRLRPLSDVSQYIQANGHLPDIPTEAEVKAQGVSLGDMQAKLLAKVEEITLHMIQQEKENRELRDQLNQQTKEIQELRERLSRPEKVASDDLTSAGAK
jgi:hypothetical protein